MELKNTEVERRTYEPPPLGNARLSDEPLIVRWDANTTAYTFTPKAGVTITRIDIGKVQLSTTNPEDKKWEGIYGVYFKKNDYDSFAGFYKENALLCTHSAYTKDCIPLCQEGFLPQNIHDLKFEPYQISVSKTHQKGLGEDMFSCDMSREQGSVPNLGISILEENKHKIKVFHINKIND